MVDYLEQILSAAVTPELLIRVNEAVNLRRESGQDTEPGFAMFVALGELQGESPPNVVAAIMLRMEALSRMVQEQTASSWTVGINGEGYVLVNEAVFHAAAHARLHREGKNSVRFDANEFLRLALEASDSEGNG